MIERRATCPLCLREAQMIRTAWAVILFCTCVPKDRIAYVEKKSVD